MGLDNPKELESRCREFRLKAETVGPKIKTGAGHSPMTPASRWMPSAAGPGRRIRPRYAGGVILSGSAGARNLFEGPYTPTGRLAAVFHFALGPFGQTRPGRGFGPGERREVSGGDGGSVGKPV